jgi:hypothetical protein
MPKKGPSASAAGRGPVFVATMQREGWNRDSRVCIMAIWCECALSVPATSISGPSAWSILPLVTPAAAAAKLAAATVPIVR